MPAMYFEFSILPALAVLGLLGTGALVWGTWSWRDSTLRAPLIWTWIAWGFLNYAGYGSASADSYANYVAAVLAIAPVLAVLGAKQPQNVAWQFIVVTMVGVLLLPVLQGWAYGDAVPHVHPLFRWLIAAHIVLAVANYFATRYRGSAIVYGIGAALLAGNYLPFRTASDDVGAFWGLICFPLAIVGVAALAWRARNGSRGLQRLWGDFRDAYGAVWALRVAERLNAAANQHSWPVEFTWGDILVIDRAQPTATAPARPSEAALDALEPEVRHRVERELRSMLRRFVSHAWIVKRLPNC
ncbi:MAG: hypothetical protein C0483_01705 [Pirellula sp.]|nr:hypothetical protein [Pirellula sp.]